MKLRLWEGVYNFIGRSRVFTVLSGFKEGQREFSNLDKGREKIFYNRKTN